MYGDDQMKLEISLATVATDLTVTFSNHGFCSNQDHVHTDLEDHVVTKPGVMSTLLVPDHGRIVVLM